MWLHKIRTSLIENNTFCGNEIRLTMRNETRLLGKFLLKTRLMISFQ